MIQISASSGMRKEPTDLQRPLTRGLAALGKYLMVAIVIVALIVLAVAVWRATVETGLDPTRAIEQTLVFAIALAVGAIPVGIPAIAATALAIGAQRMAARGAVIRQLPAVEILGATTVICSGKTGILTQNEMTVQAVWTPAGVYRITGVGYETKGAFTRDATVIEEPPPGLRQLLLAAALCNNATLAREKGRWQITGDPTEGALVVAAEKAGIRVEQLRRYHPRRDTIPFGSENRFMATLNAGPQGRPSSIILKGAPEVVLQRCRKQAGGGPVQTEAVLREAETLAAKGMRVLAVAGKSAPAGQPHLPMADIAGDFVLLGLQGMIDPPRPEVIEAIRFCHAAGIMVKMITGDHRATAEAIGGQLNIVAEADVVTGPQLAEMDDESIGGAADNTNVFARIAPEHRIKLVRALQRQNEIVAITGHGVNDAPALQQADIGVAMGTSGSAVTRQAAAVVLTDDNFTSLVAAVEEGRRVYDNLIKSLAFVLPTNLGLALIVMIAAAFFPIAERVLSDGTWALALLLPMLPSQLLWINLIATVALALPLAIEVKEPDVMQRPPRPPGAPLLSAFVIGRTLIAGTLMSAGAVGLFWWEYTQDLPMIGVVPGLTLEAVVAKAQTISVTAVVMFQVFYLLHCRSLHHSVFTIGVFSNRTVLIGVGFSIALQLAFVYAPFMHAMFGSAPVELGDWGVAALVGAIIVPVITMEKWRHGRRRKAGRLAVAQGARPRAAERHRVSVSIDPARTAVSPLVAQVAESMAGLTAAEQRDILSLIQEKKRLNAIERRGAEARKKLA